MKRKPSLSPELFDEGLSWAIEGMDAMIEAHSGPDYAPVKKPSAYVKGLRRKLTKLMRYQQERFGRRVAPLAGMEKVGIFRLLSLPPRKFKPGK